MSECKFPLCTRHAEDNGYCIGHRIYSGQKIETAKPTKMVKRQSKPIAKKSKRATKAAPGYRKFVAAYLARPENAYCKIQAPGCQMVATCINHKKRRYKATKMNEKYIEPTCSSCNTYIENNDAWARENGHLESIHN